jgi:hypothetical protein
MSFTLFSTIKASGSILAISVFVEIAITIKDFSMSDFKGRQFKGEIILWAVRWYCKYGISYRELEEMLEERGIEVDHTTLYRWVQHYAPLMETAS